MVISSCHEPRPSLWSCSLNPRHPSCYRMSRHSPMTWSLLTTSFCWQQRRTNKKPTSAEEAGHAIPTGGTYHRRIQLYADCLSRVPKRLRSPPAIGILAIREIIEYASALSCIHASNGVGQFTCGAVLQEIAGRAGRDVSARLCLSARANPCAMGNPRPRPLRRSRSGLPS